MENLRNPQGDAAVVRQKEAFEELRKLCDDHPDKISAEDFSVFVSYT